MTKQASIYTLHVGPHGDSVRGELEMPDHELADFHFALDRANCLAHKLRSAAATWAEAHQQRNATKQVLWRELHETAVDCFERIFGDAARYVEECLAGAPPGAELWVRQQHSSLSMPWGLLCTRRDALLAEKEPLQPMLWAAKYNLRTYLSPGRASRHREAPWGFEVVLCKKTYAADLELLASEAAPLARNILARSLNHRHRVRAPDAPPNCFVYVHTHSASAGGELSFEPSDGGSVLRCQPIDIVEDMVPMMNSGAAVLAVLNACDSARGVESMGPSLVLQGRNIEVACIATEFPAERGFATKFGLELIDRCVEQGESTYAAMKALRLKHYPLSIMYSHYCKTDLMMDKPLAIFDAGDLDAYRASIENANYSHRQHGAGL